jgi:hypothetical protein
MEAQRLWIVIAHQLVELFVRKTDVRYVISFNPHRLSGPQSPFVKEIQLDPKRVPAFALAEIAFLVALTSADSNVSQLAAKGLRLLAHSERQQGAPINNSVTDEDRSKRNPIYEQLGDPRVMVVGM